MLRENPCVYKREWNLWYHNGIFVVGYDFGNQKCSVNTHSRIPGLHILACFQQVDSINGYLKYTPLSTPYAGVLW